MRRLYTLLFAITVAVCFAEAQASSTAVPYAVPEPIQRVDAVVNNFRKITVLTNASDRLDRVSREKVEGVVWTLTQENRGRLSDIIETFADSTGRPITANVEAFLNKLDRPGMYSECDRLAFEELFALLFASRSQFPDDIRKRIETEEFRIRKIKPYQVNEINRGGKFQASDPSTDVWGRYIASLHQSYPREQLLKEYAAILPRR